MKIKLTLNGVTKEVEASKWNTNDRGETLVMVGGIDLVTTTGNKTHRGVVYIWTKPGQDTYTARDISDYGYHGMRGNGRGASSRMRYIGFTKEVAA